MMASMNFMKIRYVVLLLMPFFLTACDDVKGKMEVFSNFSMIDDDGKNVTIMRGNYNAKLDLDRSENEIELKIRDVAGDNDYEFDFAIPNIEDLPEHRDDTLDFVLPHDISGQPVDARIIYHHETLKTSKPWVAAARCSSVLGKPTVYITEKHAVDIEVALHNGEEKLAHFHGAKKFSKVRAIYHGKCGEVLNPDDFRLPN